MKNMATTTMHPPMIESELLDEGWWMIQTRLRILQLVRAVCRTFYRYDLDFMDGSQEETFRDVRMVMVLNHTSLFEPLWLGSFPPSFIRAMSKRFVYPIASKTLSRPIPGTLLRMLAKTVSVTRKRDDSWKEFMTHVHDDSIIGICPEGRMKRVNGLDRKGNPMTVRGGVVEVLQNLPAGKMVFLYSGGLHHIYAPGDRFPKPFKTIKARFHSVDIESYRQVMMQQPGEFRENVIRDMEARRDRYCHYSDSIESSVSDFEAPVIPLK